MGSAFRGWNQTKIYLSNDPHEPLFVKVMVKVRINKP